MLNFVLLDTKAAQRGPSWRIVICSEMSNDDWNIPLYENEQNERKISQWRLLGGLSFNLCTLYF